MQRLRIIAKQIAQRFRIDCEAISHLLRSDFASIAKRFRIDREAISQRLRNDCESIA
jgi:hypothetical protein